MLPAKADDEMASMKVMVATVSLRRFIFLLLVDLLFCWIPVGSARGSHCRVTLDPANLSK
jgi:hypothetical protein